MSEQPKEYLVDILKVDVKLEKYVDDFATFSKWEKEETVKEIHDLIVACSRPHPAPAQRIEKYPGCNGICAFEPWEREAIARKAREDAQPFIDLVILMETKQKEMNEIMRKHNLKIDNLDDPMQKLAFTFYAEIAEIAHKAEVVIKEYEESTQLQAGEPK